MTCNCKTRNVVYCICIHTCEQCKLQYIGLTTRSDERVREHIGYIRNLHTNQPTGHELYHLKVSVLEKVLDLGRSLLEVRESKYWTNKNSFYLIVNCNSVFKKEYCL